MGFFSPSNDEENVVKKSEENFWFIDTHTHTQAFARAPDQTNTYDFRFDLIAQRAKKTVVQTATQQQKQQ